MSTPAGIEPYAHGWLPVGDGHEIYWETSGNPDGRPAVWVHGGPGSPSRAAVRERFDPERVRIVLFDQRGCGRSRPHAAHGDAAMAANTTAHLIDDMERLGTHLGIDRWLLYGGSWGSTLALAYAQRHPARVRAIVLIGVTMTRPEEIDWLYRGVARFLPGPWEDFRAAVGAGEGDDLLAAYDERLNHPDRAVRLAAARAWCAWEDAVIAHEVRGRPGQYGDRDDDGLIALARICAHYFRNRAWLDDGQLLRDAPRLSGIPGVLIHGALDLGGPLYTAWQLARAWPDAELQVIDDSGHTGSPAMGEAARAALARFAAA